MIFRKKEKNLKELEDVKEVVYYVRALEKRLILLEERIRDLESNSLNNFNKFSVLRFNSFNDMGGDQSFAIALLDKVNNGFVLTSLFHKDGFRLFTKPIIKGVSKYQLLEEEETALKKAINDKKE